MKMQWLAACLAAALAVVPTAGFAANATVSPVATQSTENIFATFSQSGEHTAGVTYTVRDVYFDGYLLRLSVAQSPNEAGYAVYNDILGDTPLPEEIQGIQKSGAIPLGSYCEIAVFGQDGREIHSTLTGDGRQEGASNVRTYSYCFLPDGVQQCLRVQIFYGVMETPGQITGDMKSTELTIPIQTLADTKTVKIQGNEGKPPYIDEVFIAQTANVAGIYAFYSHNVAGACICPISFVNSADEELATGESDNGDRARNRGYAYHAIAKTGTLDTLRVLDLHSWQEYLIDLKHGTVTQAP